MKATIIRCAVALFLLSSMETAFSAGPEARWSGRADMLLWFDKPAKDRSDSLAIGNGRLGAVLHHGATEDLIQVSEETLWVNGPVAIEEGGNEGRRPRCARHLFSETLNWRYRFFSLPGIY